MSLQKYPLPVADMLEITAKILEDNQENSAVGRDDYEKVMNILNEEITAVRGRIHDRKTKIENLSQEIKTQYDDLRECQYQLHAVFIHQGEICHLDCFVQLHHPFKMLTK